MDLFFPFPPAVKSPQTHRARTVLPPLDWRVVFSFLLGLGLSFFLLYVLSVTSTSVYDTYADSRCVGVLT